MPPYGSSVLGECIEDQQNWEDVEAAKNVIVGLKASIRGLEQENCELKKMVDELKANLSFESSECMVRQAQIDTLNKRNNELQFMIKLEKLVVAALNARLSSKDADVADIQKQLIEYEQLSSRDFAPYNTAATVIDTRSLQHISAANKEFRSDAEAIKYTSANAHIQSEYMLNPDSDEVERQRLALCGSERKSVGLTTPELSSNEVSKLHILHTETNGHGEGVGAPDRAVKDERKVENPDEFPSPEVHRDLLYDDLLDRVLHAEARAMALTNQLASIPSSMQLAIAERHVLESKLHQMAGLKESEISQLKDEMVNWVCLVSDLS